ncbi:hypothetical protein TNCV_1693361 [Trichonephila clavipes]|nr:hypothetical protein TNCV_1693361 [Trichonephila clavipes]
MHPILVKVCGMYAVRLIYTFGGGEENHGGRITFGSTFNKCDNRKLQTSATDAVANSCQQQPHDLLRTFPEDTNRLRRTIRNYFEVFTTEHPTCSTHVEA